MPEDDFVARAEGTIGVLSPRVDELDPVMSQSVSPFARPGTAFRLYQKVSRARLLVFIGAAREASRG